MKKYLAAIFLFVFLCLTLSAATITVTCPAAGTTWAVGQTQTIAWTTSGSMDSRVKIILRSGSSVVLTVSGDTANDGEFSWTIPSSIATGPDDVYYVRVKTLDNSIQGDSGNFAVMPALPPPPPPPPPSLTLTSPNGGEEWMRGKDQDITWNAVMIPGKVRLELVKEDGGVLGTIADNLAPFPGSYPWKVGKYGSGQSAPGGKYFVRVRSLSAPQFSDQGNQAFEIKVRLQEMQLGSPINLPKPDLVACVETAVYVPLKTLGWFHIYVRNIGQGTAKAPFDVWIFLAGHDPFRVTVNSDMAPGVTYWVRNFADSKMSTYTMGLQVKADYDNVVAESNEDNNLASGVLYIADGNPQSSGPITCGDGSTVQSD